MQRMPFGFSIAIIVVTAFPALADAPSLGLLYNQKETGSLTYECALNGQYLECDFVQISVRRKANPSEFADAQQKARDSYPALKKEMERDKECGQADAMASALRGVPPKGADFEQFTKGFASMTTLQKADMSKVASAILKFCRAPTEENFLAFAEASFDIETRTCTISANPYKQRFKQVSGSEVWVAVQDSPQGICGVVNVSRFERESTEPKYPLWKYFAKKVVTNKSGKLLPGMACSDLDENEYEYDWRSKAVQLSCDYITFGAL